MKAANEPEPIGESLAHTVLKMPEFRDLFANYAEIALDSLVTGVADEIPLVGTARALGRGMSGFREARLLRKLLAMLGGLGEIDSVEAAKWSKKLQDDEQVEEFGERVIGIVDRVESATKARIVGQLLREYLSDRCDRETFLRSIDMIDRALTEDLMRLIERWTEGMEDPAFERLIAVGLMTDQQSRLLIESSKPPAPSSEGALIRRASSRS